VIWNNLELPDSPYYQDKWRTIYFSDNQNILPQLAANYIASVVTDPPYELGFMGKSWDKSGVAYDLKVWSECLRLLKPGAYLLSFGGSRTYHRMACAIEDAGFEIRDMVEWIYFQGFPKSLDISKQISKKYSISLCTCNNQELCRSRIVSELPQQGRIPNSKNIISDKSPDKNSRWGIDGKYFCPKCGNLRKDIGGTSLKPAHEPICMARKPLLEKTVAENVLKYGTGGINIDECRIPIDPKIDDSRLGGKGDWSSDKMAKNVYEGGYAGKRVGSSPEGRFPANLIHDGSQEVMDLFPETKSGKPGIRHSGNSGAAYGAESRPAGTQMSGFGDSGSAARFFMKCEQDMQPRSFIYVPKASRSERDSGLEDIKPSQSDESRKVGNPGGDNPRNRGVNLVKNNHPTVKPLALMKYLIKLITPPNGIILDPFCGSGTTLVAAGERGFISIGIDSDEKSCEIAAKRCSGSREPPAPP
jgi:site-specific DNA-methyltransferase (adenine-specific)